MSVLGLGMWIIGVVMVLGGFAVGQPIGIVVTLVGVLLIIGGAKRDYDSSRTH